VAEAEEVAQGFEILQLAAQVADSLEALGGLEEHAIEKFIHKLGDAAAVFG
jgi:hypothetical protein